MSLRARLSLVPEPLYLMDGSAFVFRGFYAFQNMSRSDGFPTNALYIVTRILLKLLREERPSHFAFVLDGKGPNFRHERFPAYKAQRSATPEGLVLQIPPILRIIETLGIPVLVSEDCEADDCIASLAERFRSRAPVVIVGADKDLKQCLHENVILWDPGSKEEKVTTLDDFRKENGFEPASWPDYQALVGDSSDNIPGVPQIGPKSAAALIKDFPHLEELFDRLPAVPPKMRSKLEGQRDNALLYRELTTLRIDTCLGTNFDGLAVRPPDLAKAMEFMSEFELRTLAREVESMARAGAFEQRAQGNKETARSKTLPTMPDAKKEALRTVDDSVSPTSESGSPKMKKTSSKDTVPGDRSSQAQEQGSLFASPAPVGVLSCLEVACASELPPYTPSASAVEEVNNDNGSTLVLLPSTPGAAGVIVAGTGTAFPGHEEGWERLYTGPLDDLATYAAGVVTAEPRAVLAAPDVKALFKQHAAFKYIGWEHWFDFSLAAYLLNPEDRGYAWEQVAQRWGDMTGSTDTLQEHPGKLALAIYSLLRSHLAGAELSTVFSQMEMPLIPVLASMEERGIAIDRNAFASFLEETQVSLDRLTEEIHSMAGRSFNIRSSQQLGDVLFSVLDLPKAGKTRGGAASTSQEALEKLTGKHPIVEAILEYRKLEKLRSTYLEPLPLLADSNGRIHTTFNQTATATGRLSSSNPNLQNIPVRGELGGRMRACFVAATGLQIVSADYSQIELRVLAHLSGDPTLLDAFHKNEDIHARTAGLLFDVPLADVTHDQRRSAKTINFGLIYGMGAQRLGQELHISMKEAKEFIEKYFSRLTKLKEFYDAIENDAKEHGFIATMTGRRRYAPDILSQNNQLRSQARRQAINARIQGTAADIIKLAMIAVENDVELKSLDAKLLLQIHDELVLEAPASNAEAAGKRVAALMSSVRPGGETLSVPLLVDWGVGNTWADAH